MTDLLLGLLLGWLLVLTYLVFGYRAAIIALQRDVAGEGGLLDEVTRPK